MWVDTWFATKSIELSKGLFCLEPKHTEKMSRKLSLILREIARFLQCFLLVLMRIKTLRLVGSPQNLVMSPWTREISSENSSASATTVCQYEPELTRLGEFNLQTRFDVLQTLTPYERTDVFIFFDDAGNILSPCPGQLLAHDHGTEIFHVRVFWCATIFE